MISEVEKRRLNTILSENVEAQRLKEEIIQKVHGARVMTFLDEKTSTEYAEEAIQIARKRDRVWNARQWLPGLAVMIVLGIIIFTLYIPKRDSLSVVSTQPNAGTSTQVTLSLPNGESVILDTGSNKIASKGIDISTSQSSLRYKSSYFSSEYASLRVPFGKDYKIFLDDGTEVHLNSGSELKFPVKFDSNKREIILNGEAYVKVAKSAKIPFFVQLPHGTVQVLGTAFNVNTYDTGIHKIALVEGAVKIINDHATVSLRPGEEAVANATGIKTETFDRSEVLAWREGKYYFDNASLQELSKVVTRWYGVHVSVDSRRAEDQRFSGILRKSHSIDVLLKGLEISNGIKYDKDPNGTFHIR